MKLNDPTWSLRSPELCPHPLKPDRKSTIAYVASGRRAWSKSTSTDLAGDQLLTYEPDNNMADGLAEGESDGYLDVNNMPPWDTWIAYLYEAKTNYLLSWVPKPFVPLVSAGIRVNPECCFYWLDQTSLELVGLLRNRGVGVHIAR